MPVPPVAPDPADVLTSLGWRAAEVPAVLSGGWDNHLWRFRTDDGREHVLRVYRQQGDAAAARAENERAALDAAAAAGIAVPRSEAAGTFDGSPVLVQELVTGTTLLAALERRPWQLRRLGRAMGALQAQLHAMTPPASVRRLGPEAVREPLAHPALLDALRREARLDAFCHLDFHPLNVLVHRGRITALLDWTNAAVTDRRADLAYTETTLLRVPIPPGPKRAALQTARTLLHRSWRAGYTAAAGSFPLDPLFRATSVASFLGDLEAAVAEGRGWATADDVEVLRGERDRLLTAAGLA